MLYNVRPGRVAEWLRRRTHNPVIAGSSPTGASDILGQDMNPVNELYAAPEVDLRECTLHLPL